MYEDIWGSSGFLMELSAIVLYSIVIIFLVVHVYYRYFYLETIENNLSESPTLWS
jgi:hypothetical protein